MNRVLIVSDNHGLTKELDMIKTRHKVNEMIHCGDSELSFHASEMESFHKVSGNCDFDSSYPQELVVDIAGLRFFVVHGHRHQVNRDLYTLSYTADEKKAGVVCYGHTHIARTDLMDTKLMINPGSVAQSRSNSPETYAILEWNTAGNLEVKYYDLSGERVEGLDFKTL